MFQRLISDTLLSTARSFPVTVLTGPRQSGKTTLLRQLFPDYYYVNLEAPDVLLHAQQDPRGFLHSNQQNWIIDEVQHDPALFSYLQELVDQPQRKRRFILSGSQNFLLVEKISQTLAGRSAILELLPLSYQEYSSATDMPALDVWDFLYQGGYPRPYNEKLSLKIWYDSYIRTYLERDIRSLVNVKDLAKFQLFLKLCAGRHGQLLNMNSLANDAGVSHTTAGQWISLLETSYIVYKLQPYYQNFNKRLVKTPKLYFYDSAIVCMLLGIDSSQHLKIHASRGAIFEGFVLAEIIKTYLAQGQRPHLYFWRDHSGIEVDGILEKGERLQALEMKSGSTLTIDFFENLVKWQAIAAQSPENCYLVYTGDSSQIRKGMTVFPWDQVAKFLN